jgi:hypothetical protein
MHFKTKDLLVTVLPKASADLLKACLFRTHICKNPTFCTQATGLCGVGASLCRFNSCAVISDLCLAGSCGRFSNGCFDNSCGRGGSACDFTDFCFGSREPFVFDHIEDLVALKAELKETLTQLDAIEKQGLPSRISSMAEADALERSLKEALDQVSKAKSKFK